MKKIASFALILLMVMSITALSYAGNEVTPLNKSNEAAVKAAPSKESSSSRSDALIGPNKKLFRGVKNALFGWTEIPKSMISTTNEYKNPIIGLTLGTLRGIGKAFPKTASGLADVVTFPVGDYDKPLIKTEPLAKETPAKTK